MSEDMADMIAHPEWFEVEELKPPPLPSAEDLALLPSEIRRQVLQNHVSRPVLYRRKVVPFVLRIKGPG